MDVQQKVKLVCHLFKFIITIILTVVSILISKEVWEQYQTKATSFKHSEQDITENESVTVVVSLWPLKNTNYSDEVPYQAREQWQLNSDFNLSFGIAEYKLIREEVRLTEPNANLSISHSSIGKVKFEKLTTILGDRYKISANLVNVKQPYDAFLQVKIAENIPDDKIPEVVVMFSSELNSYGAIMADWLEGDYVVLNKVKGYNFLFFQPQKVIKLNSQKCQTLSYYECLSSKLKNEDYSHCPRRCAAISTPLKKLSYCETSKEFKCSYGIVTKVQNDNSSSKCKPSCNVINMKQTAIYQEDQDDANAKRNVFVIYRFQNTNMKVEEEYLVQDFVGMLGSIGGTLGMCIGFSFVGLLFSILDQLQGFFENLSNTMKKTDHKIIKVENKIDDMKTSNESLSDLNTRIQRLEEHMCNCSSAQRMTKKQKSSNNEN